MRQYTNNITPDIIRSLKNLLPESELENFSGEEWKPVLEEIRKREKTPVRAIYRHATAGALTRNGGMVYKASGRNYFLIEDGTELQLALVGDEVVYPNGDTAKIVSGTGELLKSGDRSLALVGSLLDNGDVIVSTPQGAGMLVEYEDMRFGDDFMKPEA